MLESHRNRLSCIGASLGSEAKTVTATTACPSVIVMMKASSARSNKLVYTSTCTSMPTHMHIHIHIHVHIHTLRAQTADAHR